MSDEEEDTYLPVRGVGRRGSDPTGYDIVLEPKLLAEERDNACMSDEEEDTYQMRRRIHTCSPKSVIMLNPVVGPLEKYIDVILGAL